MLITNGSAPGPFKNFGQPAVLSVDSTEAMPRMIAWD